ncbi:MAG: dihydroorotase [Firmicutes bacterium]|nr:dihydroorotase [Bacillota bacterium]
MSELLIKNVRIVADGYNEDEVYQLLVSDHKIYKIDKEIKSDTAEVIDGKGYLLMPGLIDMSCKLCEAGFENTSNIITVSHSAVEGGFTSLVCSPKTQPCIDTKSVVEYISSKVKTYSPINFYLYGSITKNCDGTEIAEMGEMISRGVIALSDGGTSIQDASILRHVLMYSKMFDIPVVTRCADKNLCKNGCINKGYYSTKLGLNGCPLEAEETIVARDLILAKYANARIHITKVSTGGSVYHLRGSRKRGINATADTCPQYFTKSECEADNYNTIAKVDPPLRTQDDIDLIIEGLRDGTIDVISSGHTPATIDTKDMEFENASYGISSLETALMVTFTALVKNNDFTPLDIAKKMSENPAKILGLKTKGKIAVGMDADLIIVDDKNAHKINAANFVSRAKYSLYDGEELYGKTLVTICGGEILKKSI